MNIALARNALLAVLCSFCASAVAQRPASNADVVKIDPKLTARMPGGTEAAKSIPANELGVVVDADDAVSAFRIGYGVLKVPRGTDLKQHANSAGLQIAKMESLDDTKFDYDTKDGVRSKTLQAKRRHRDKGDNYDQEVALVRLPIDRADVPRFLARLKAQGDSKQLRAANRDSAVRTLAAIDRHREMYEAKGYLLTLDTLFVPAQVLGSTSDGNDRYCAGACGDAMSDPYWTLTNLKKAWRLAQVAHTPFQDPEQGFTDNIPNTVSGTVAGPVILGIVDTGFATTVADHRADIIFHRGLQPIGGPGFSNFHGTKVSSAAASPVNDGAGAAGTSLYSRNSVVKKLDDRAETALLWAEVDEQDMWSLSWTVQAAVAGGSDVINLSWIAECGWWCRNFGSLSGWSVLADALEFADEFAIPMIVPAGNGTENQCGSDIQNTDDTYLIPCEMGNHAPVCVGGVDRSGSNVCNFGGGVDVWAPARNLPISGVPGSTSISDGGTSLASPFVAGIVAMTTAAGGSRLSSAAVRDALRSTAVPTSDSRVPRMLDAYAFMRRFVSVRPDGLEYNDSQNWAQVLPTDNLLSTKVSGSISLNDTDYFVLETNVQCPDVQFDVRFVPDPGTGEIEADLEFTWFAVGEAISEDLRRFRYRAVRDLYWPGDGKLLGIRAQGALPTGYSIVNLQVTPNAFATNEGPAAPQSCDGLDNDCDGTADEGFPDADRDGIADCVDNDDDEDCFLDSTDNCPLTANGHQFCPNADNPERLPLRATRGCGDRDCNDPIDPDSFTEIGPNVAACFEAFPAEPGCFADGCPWPGPLIHPEIAQVVTGAMQVRDALERGGLSQRELDRRFGAIGDIRLTPEGEFIVPEELRSKRPVKFAAGEGADRAATRQAIDSIGKLRACKPIFSYSNKLEEVRRRNASCWNRVGSGACQVDSDNDGVGDRCDSP